MDAPRFTHSAFVSSHYEACLGWYADVARLRLVKERGDAGERVAWMAPADEDAPIFVFIESPAGDRAPEPLSRHLGFEFASIAALEAHHARLLAAGRTPTPVEFVNEVVGTVFLLHDPDGRVVEFSHGQDVSPTNWDAPGAGPALP